MNCHNHQDQTAASYCRVCGKGLCPECQRPAQGTVYCVEHVPSEPPANTAATAGAYKPGSNSPGLAFLLGLIPGVGAIYNGQYVKGLVHVVVFGTLISIMSSHATGGFEPLFGLLISVFYAYMPFEAYHTAKRRQQGEAVDEFSSLFPLKTAAPGFPVGPVLLIVIGVVFLLNTLDILALDKILRWWPVLLILLGGFMLYTRLVGGPHRAPSGEEVERGS